VTDKDRTTEGPGDPITPAAEGWAALHEWYTGLREAGFTMIEAATVIGSVITQSQNPGSQA
jgi:hypothetical protein